MKDINIKKLPYKIYFTRYGGANYGMNRLITVKNPNHFHKRKWGIGLYLFEKKCI